MNRDHSDIRPASLSAGGVQRGSVICAFTETLTSRIEQVPFVDSVRQLQRIGERVSPTKLLSATFGPSFRMSARTSSKVRPWTS